MKFTLQKTPETAITEAIVKEHGFTDEEYERVLAIMGRTPNLIELGIFSVMWSEHCSYKSTRMHLKELPTEAPHVICGPGENAGVIDIGDGQAAIFKMESHNHPSFIEPYQGAATGVGGIMRDVFTMGARPIAMLNALRFGEINHPKTRHLLAGVVAGIGGYGNCMGIPTVAGECDFHASYNGNILVNAMCVGIADTDKIFYSSAENILGCSVVYAGAKTGRDGIHGATMASAEFDDDSADKRPTVQVGDPFTEKRVMEACLELMATDAILSIQDMGAAGLTCSSLEMADKSGTGIEVNMNAVPVREQGMTPYEIMLSESQERMLMVLKPGKEALAHAVFDKWEIDSAVIGKITDTGNLVLKQDGEIIAQMPVSPLSEQAPVYDRPHQETLQKLAIFAQDVTAKSSTTEALETLLHSPDLASKRWIWQQYDSQVMNDTVARSGGDAAVVRVHGTEKALAMTSDCAPRYCHANPYKGGMQAVVETWRNLTAVGATPLAITNCLNFGNPQRPEIMGQLVGCLKGMGEACRALNYPIVSGNVSLYNETNGEGIYPTPTIGGVGILQDVSKRVGNAFVGAGDVIAVIGDTQGALGASLYLREVLGLEEGDVPDINLETEKNHGDFIRGLITAQSVSAVHDVSDGGLLVAVAEMAMRAGQGASVANASAIAAHGYWFGEDQARYVISFAKDQQAAIEAAAAQANIPFAVIGAVGGKALEVDGESVDVAALCNLNEATIPDLFVA